jgi:predicted dehydrogenase
MALRCGVAGLNRGRQFINALNAVQGCEVVAVCDPSAQRLAAAGGIKAYADFNTFLDESNLDIVAVITPGPLHFEQSAAALRRGAHVLCETPPVYSVEEAWQVVETARRCDRRYMLAENYIWQGWVERIAEFIEQGLLGDIVYAEGDYTHDCRGIMLADEQGFVPFAERDRRPNASKTWRATHLPPLSYCSHTLGPLLHLMKDRVTLAVGMDAGPRTWPEVCPTDLQAGLFRTEKGAVIRLTNGFCMAHPLAFTYNLCGTRGAVKLSRLGQQTAVTYSDSRGGGWQPVELPWTDRRDGRPHLEVMVEQFVEAIRRGTPPPLDEAKSMGCVVPGLCAIESSRQGSRPQVVPDFRGTRG